MIRSACVSYRSFIRNPWGGNEEDALLRLPPVSGKVQASGSRAPVTVSGARECPSSPPARASQRNRIGTGFCFTIYTSEQKR